jgi:hypothetical protein
VLHLCALLHLKISIGIDTREEELWVEGGVGVFIVGIVEHLGVMFKKFCILSAPGGTRDDLIWHSEEINVSVQ